MSLVVVKNPRALMCKVRLLQIGKSLFSTLLTAFKKKEELNSSDEKRAKVTLKNTSDCKIVVQTTENQGPIFLDPGDCPFQFKISWFAFKKSFMVFR